MQWLPTFPVEQFRPGLGRVFKQATSQIAIFLVDGQFYAVDNRCPHEGYPLSQGSVAGCVLTCKWHNFKFDLRDGACVMGEEGVRSYPTRVENGTVEVDLSPPESLLRGLWKDLEEAMSRQEVGRMARNVVRLVDLGVDPTRIALFGACFDADRGEYGLSHAMAVAEEVTARGTSGVEPLLPLVQALDLAARNIIRLPLRPVPEVVDPGEDPVEAGNRLRELVETEKDPEAEALVRGAVAKGWRRRELHPWFLQLCADHFLDFGHMLIYSIKAFDLLDRVNWEGAASILGGLVHSITCGTREELLPPWSGWRRRMGEEHPVDQPALPLDALVDAEPAEAFGQVARSEDPLNALSIAAAERILRFDPSIDRSPEVEEGWLDVTHRLTFVHAVRRAGGSPRRLLLQAAHFVAIARPLDGPRPALQPQSGDLEGILETIQAGHAEEALNRSLGYLQAGLPVDDLIAGLEGIVYRDHATRAIFLAHHLKTLRAGEQERLATGDDRPLLAAIRLLAIPARERNVERTVRNAIALVREGRPPRSLVA